MKGLIIRIVIALAIIDACAPIGGAQSSNSSPQPAALSAVITPAGKIMVIQLDTSLSTIFTKKGDYAEFHTVADVVVDDQILIPNHSLVRGRVTESKGSRMMGKRAKIQLRLVDVTLPDGTRLPITASIIRAGTDPIRDSTLTSEAVQGGGNTAIVNGAVQGAFIGLMSGRFDTERILYATAAGAALPTVGMMLNRGSELDIPADSMFEARFEKPLEIPFQLVIAQNSPVTRSTPGRNVANASSLMDEPTGMRNKRPKLKHPQIDPLIEIVSISKPEPDDIFLPDNLSIEEEMNDRSQVESLPTTEEAPLSEPQPNPIASLKMPPEKALPVEPFDEGFSVSVDVKMVQVDAVVRDHWGHIMSNLGMEDFKVFDNNMLQELAGFSLDKKPLAVAIVVDHSGSVLPYISQLRYIASRALSNLKEQDAVCLFAFDQNVQLIEGLTTDRQQIARAIAGIGGGESTNILDALHAATSYLGKMAPNRRHAVIMVSDNRQTALSKANEHDVIKLAQEKDVVIYSLKTGMDLSSPGRFSGSPLQSIFLLGNPHQIGISRDPAGKVARDSGGEVINVDSVESLDGALNTVITHLRTSYSLGYYPPESRSGTFRTITVKLADKFGKSGSNYSIQAKKGYYPIQTANNE